MINPAGTKPLASNLPISAQPIMTQTTAPQLPLEPDENKILDTTGLTPDKAATEREIITKTSMQRCLVEAQMAEGMQKHFTNLLRILLSAFDGNSSSEPLNDTSRSEIIQAAYRDHGLTGERTAQQIIKDNPKLSKNEIKKLIEKEMAQDFNNDGIIAEQNR